MLPPDLETWLAALPSAGRCWSVADITRVEKSLGLPIPEPMRSLWTRFGCPSLSDDMAVDVWDAPMVDDHTLDFEEYGFAGLLPLATNRGGADFVMDCKGAVEGKPGAVYLVELGALDAAYMTPIAPDVPSFLRAARDGVLRTDGPTLGDLWSNAMRDRAIAWVERRFGDAARALSVLRVHYGSEVPSLVEILDDVVLDGTPCLGRSYLHVACDGTLEGATLSRNHVVCGVECAAGTGYVLHEGELRRFTPVAPFPFEGLLFAANAEITLPGEHGPALFGVLASPAVLGGLPCIGRVVLDPKSHSPNSATLAEDAVVDGECLPAGTHFELMDETLYVVEVPHDMLVKGRQVAAGKRTTVL